ncbi:hypothetical protein BBW65_05785 [Helicobacter enhydrae]|uniref:Uncharacterized protein n=2 Tax=Helicobacter enhydrae TaxID=222136 RepID=A0A1B1U6G7_9HELI|nr:hypothetical protein BBW65_05785 [Helicobacter enhydrae]
MKSLIKNIGDSLKELTKGNRHYFNGGEESLLNIKSVLAEFEKTENVAHLVQALQNISQAMENDEMENNAKITSSKKIIENLLLWNKMYPKRIKKLEAPTIVFNQIYRTNRIEIPFDEDGFKGLNFEYENLFFTSYTRETFQQEVDFFNQYKIKSISMIENEEKELDGLTQEIVKNNMLEILERGFQLLGYEKKKLDNLEMILLNNPLKFIKNVGSLQNMQNLPLKSL